MRAVRRDARAGRGASPPGSSRVAEQGERDPERGGLRLLIDAEPDLEVVGEAVDGEDAVRVVREVAPDVVLMDVAEFAAELYLGETTVKTHLGRVLDKLGLRDRPRAIAFAHESGLMGEDG